MASVKKYDLVIVGGGSAGLAAAISAFDNGIRSILVLEKDRWPGGILLQCVHNGFGLHEFKEELSGPQYAHRFALMAAERGIECRFNSMVLDISRDLTLHYSSLEEGYVEVKAGAVICATGCSEKTRGAINIPGSRPSGVMTAGLAQRYMNIEGYMVGRRVFILGSGDIGLIMARRLTLEGAEVLGVAEILPYSNGLNRNIVQCLRDFDIPLYLRHTVRQIVGKERVEKVIVAPVDDNLQIIEGRDMEFEVDTLLLSVGLLPNNPMLEKLGLEMDPRTKGPVVNCNLMTSVPGVFVCGNSLHVHDLVDHVTEEGRIVGANAAKFIKGELEGGNERKVFPIPDRAAHTIPEKGMICIVCPKGCNLIVDENGEVSGNTCPRGRAYAIAEATHPTRMITSTAAIESSVVTRIPVMTSAPVPKGRIAEVMAEINRLRLKAPVKIEEPVITDVLGLGVNVIATREVPS